MNDKVLAIVFDSFNTKPAKEFFSDLEFLKSRLSIVRAEEISKLKGEEIWQYLHGLLAGQTDESTDGFLKNLIDADLLEDFLKNPTAFIDQLRQAFDGRSEILFYSAIKLDPEFQESISRSLLTRLPQALRVVFLQDPELITGFILDFEGKTYDYSLKYNGSKLIAQQLESLS
ncbi:MAG TPA: F0F1 ATP synthase subunit delta [Candidatus Saccharimonadales bacterium]|nr:F0F1 ATP synthase subunit delta [Candidatus Saccharimonadales bacterium]